MAGKKGAPLPASSAGLLRFFEDETKGFKVDPKIVVTIPSSLIIISWLLDIFLVKWPFMTEPYSDVSKIHKRYSLTLLNPSSFYHSLIISIIVASVLVTLTVSVYLESKELIFRLLAVLGTLLVTQIIDSRFTRN